MPTEELLKRESEDVSRSYQRALDLMQQARGYESEGKEPQAIEAYFQAAELAQRAIFLWGLHLQGKREEAVANLEGLDALLSQMPSQSDIEGLLPQIMQGLDGRMKGIYEGPARQERGKRTAQESHERYERERYLLKRELNGQQTAQALDILRGIDGLELSYERVFALPPQQRQDIEGLIAEQRRYIEAQIKDGLTRGLNLSPGTLLSHEIRLDLILFDDPMLYHMRQSVIDIGQKEVVAVKLNFDGKTGLEIVQFGFTNMQGYDPSATTESLFGIQNSAVHQKGPKSPELADTYQLLVYNPEKLTFTPHRGPETLSKAVERAQYIASQLTAVK